MFDLQKMMKQAQDMQSKMQSIQEELERTEFQGQAGNGAVTVVMNGKHELVRVSISPEAMGDKAMLEDLILSAVNNANATVNQTAQEKMQSLTGGLKIPGLKLPF